jgi:hypothetical protein
MRRYRGSSNVVGCVIGVLLVAGSVAAQRQGPGQPDPSNKDTVLTVCAPGLRGILQLGAEASHAVAVRRATVELLTWADHTETLFTTLADRTGRFAFGGGAVKKGSEWWIRATGPGSHQVVVKLQIDPACKVPVIPLTPGGAK